VPNAGTTVKTLFALSGNTCYYFGCEELLTRKARHEEDATRSNHDRTQSIWLTRDDLHELATQMIPLPLARCDHFVITAITTPDELAV
jgi:hypothetical protein